MFHLNFDNSVPHTVHDVIFSNPLCPPLQPETQDGGRCTPEKSEILLQLGILYWRRGEFDRSEKLIAKAHEVLEDDRDIRFLAQCYIGLALVKNSLDKTDEAIKAYEQAITLVPENIHLWNNLGNLYIKNNWDEKAFDAFKKALQIDPHDAVAWIGLANTYYQKGSIDEAIKAYKRVVSLRQNTDVNHSDSSICKSEIKKQLVLPWLRLSELYTKKCQYQKAIDACEKVLAFDAENAEIWHALGVLHIRTETFEDAVNALSKAVENNPNHGKTYLELGMAYSKLGRYRDSIPHYLESISLLETRKEKEIAREQMENAISALRELSTARTTRQTDEQKAMTLSQISASWFYYKYAEEITTISFSSNNHPNAPVKQQLDKGERKMPCILPSSSKDHTQVKVKPISAHPQAKGSESADPHVWNEKGNIYFNNKAYEEAINAYTIAIELDPDFGQPYNNLALIYFIQGNYAESILHYQKSVNLLTTDRERAIAWNGLGNVYRRIKDYENARIAYQNATELDEQTGGVYDNTKIFQVSEEHKTADFWNDLGKFFFKTGVYDKAASAFREAIRLEPSSGHSYSHLARALTAQGQYKEAVSLYHKSIDLIPNSNEKANAWNRLGDVHRKLNDYDDALSAYQNATALTNDGFSLLHRTRFSLLSNCTAKH